MPIVRKYVIRYILRKMAKDHGCIVSKETIKTPFYYSGVPIVLKRTIIQTLNQIKHRKMNLNDFTQLKALLLSNLSKGIFKSSRLGHFLSFYNKALPQNFKIKVRFHTLYF